MNISDFHADNPRTGRYLGLYQGTVIDRQDPQQPRGLGRVRVEIPGLFDEGTGWALPMSGGAAQWGTVCVPPVDADVYVMFVNGDPDQPVWMPGPMGDGEQFPEHEDPDVSVWGQGPFRMVVDNRADVQTATFKVIKSVNGAEESIIELEFNAATNSVRLFATTALQLAAQGILDIDCTGDVQVRQRKVMPASRPIN